MFIIRGNITLYLVDWSELIKLTIKMRLVVDANLIWIII